MHERVYQLAVEGSLLGETVDHDRHGDGEVLNANDMSQRAVVRFESGVKRVHFRELEVR